MAKLTADRILDGAVALADEIGIDALTIRRLANALDTKPMTIYHHLPNKDAIIGGMVNRVFEEIELPTVDTAWREAMTRRSGSMRAVLGRHPWATSLLDSRTNTGHAGLRHHDTRIGCLRNAGFTMSMIGHTLAVLDSYVYGFALQEVALPATSGDEIAELAQQMVNQSDAGEYPNLMQFATEQVMSGNYDFADEFDYGLNLILDGLEARAKLGG